VLCALDLAVKDEILVARESLGEIMQVIRDVEPVQYHVLFQGRVFQVPEPALNPANPDTFTEPES
jgi:nitrogen fixation protein NifZ